MTLFEAFLANPTGQRIYLVELFPYDKTAGQIKSLYYSTHGFTTEPADDPPNTYYDARVATAINFTRSLFQQGRIGGKSIPGFGTLELRNEDGGLDDFVNYAFDGRRVVVRLGGEDFRYADFGVIYDGTSDGIEFTDRTIVIRLRDLQYLLQVPLHDALYDGSGGWEGGADIKGKVKPEAFGIVRDAEPVPVYPAVLGYQLHNGPIEEIIAVKVGGIPLAYGGDHASLEQLEAATVAADAFASCLAQGAFRLGAEPSHRVTVDFKADKTDGVYVETVADIVKRIVMTRAGLDTGDLVTASFDALNLANAAPVGLYAAEPINVDAALDLVVNSIGAWYGFNRLGRFEVGRLTLPEGSPVATYTAEHVIKDGFKRLPTKLPIWRLRLGYRRCWTPLSDSEFAAAAAAAQKAFQREALRIEVAQDTAVKQAHILAGDDYIETLLDDPADAAAECARLFAIDKVQRDIYHITVKTQPFARDVGDEIRLEYKRLGLGAGKNFRIISLTEDSRRNRVEMEIWG